ncbi:hypothetical protein D9758_014989 [Tetrapyrgos nigripes]|uniref:F-box domain-containing protein n=1 Tax=Tetrapyrgos nigripes TaxID=182062 RepID=A0A8H5CE74_9AGAR|nr:hypothetical protein D9758_014989 [Tetrapyrgos nigripes]
MSIVLAPRPPSLSSNARSTLFLVRSQFSSFLLIKPPLRPEKIQSLVLHELSPVDRHHFSLVNKKARELVLGYNERCFRIRKLLLRFFDTLSNVARFRILQYELGLLVSGSTALQFFDDIVYPNSDLDTYVELTKFRPYADFLFEIGYAFVPVQGQVRDFETAFSAALSAERPAPVHHVGGLDWEGYHGNGMAEVFNFEKGRKKVQVITCVHTPIEVILHFHSTCVMNVISHSHGYSLFPRYTFEDHVSLHTPTFATVKDKHKRAREKYAQRGWTMVPAPSAFSRVRPNSECRNSLRYIGDSSCWVIPLEPIFEPGDADAGAGVDAGEDVVSMAESRSNIPIHTHTNIPMTLETDPIRAHSWHNIVTYTQFVPKCKVMSSPFLDSTYCVAREIHYDVQNHFLALAMGRTQAQNKVPGNRGNEPPLALALVDVVHKLCDAKRFEVKDKPVLGLAINRMDDGPRKLRLLKIQEALRNVTIR